MRAVVLLAVIVGGMVSALAQVRSDAVPAVQPPSPLHVNADALPQWQRDVWGKVDTYGRFVTSAELERNPLFRALAPDQAAATEREEIYLLTVCRPRENPGKRILNATATVRISEVHEHTFDIVPVGFLANGQSYSLVKVVGADDLRPDIREELLGSAPQITIIKARMK